VFSPNQPTQPALQPWDSSASDPTQVSRPVTVGGPKNVWWHPWAAGAGAVLLLLMAIGAWQAVREHDDAKPNSESPPATSLAADVEPTVPSPKPLPRDDFNCSDGRCTCVAGGRCTLDCPREGCELSCTKTRNCTLECGEACSASCVDASESCEITLGNDGKASCDGSGRCRVTCQGACEVQCADEDCQVTCRGDRSRKARRCGDMLVCGRDC
jgi:hypothetical protein